MNAIRLSNCLGLDRSGSKLLVKVIETRYFQVKSLNDFGSLSFQLDWLQSIKQFFINVSYHILVASLTLMALFYKTEPSELEWLQVYDMTH